MGEQQAPLAQEEAADIVQRTTSIPDLTTDLLRRVCNDDEEQRLQEEDQLLKTHQEYWEHYLKKKDLEEKLQHLQSELSIVNRSIDKILAPLPAESKPTSDSERSPEDEIKDIIERQKLVKKQIREATAKSLDNKKQFVQKFVASLRSSHPDLYKMFMQETSKSESPIPLLPSSEGFLPVEPGFGLPPSSGLSPRKNSPAIGDLSDTNVDAIGVLIDRDDHPIEVSSDTNDDATEVSSPRSAKRQKIDRNTGQSGSTPHENTCCSAALPSGSDSDSM